MDTIRANNAALHGTILRTMLGKSLDARLHERIWRARVGPPEADHYTVFSLIQYINVPASPGRPVPSVMCTITTFQGVFQFPLFGGWHPDLIVAFFGLDNLTVTQVKWIDETDYSAGLDLPEGARNRVVVSQD